MSIHTTMLGRVDYEPTVEAMRLFTEQRAVGPESLEPDQLWICEHPPVFTQGLAGRAEHLFQTHGVPVVQTNRGGQVTYHGPGQVVAYPLVDLRRAGYFVKEYVYRIEEAVIRTLRHFNITGHRVRGAPGIYVRLADPTSHRPLHSATSNNPSAAPDFSGLGKIAALGIKVSRNCTYHGVALNVSMDLAPYTWINPCGYAGLQTVDLSTIGVQAHFADTASLLGQKLETYLAP